MPRKYVKYMIRVLFYFTIIIILQYFYIKLLIVREAFFYKNDKVYVQIKNKNLIFSNGDKILENKVKSCKKDEKSAGECYMFEGICPYKFACTGNSPDDLCCGTDVFEEATHALNVSSKFSGLNKNLPNCNLVPPSDFQINFNNLTEQYIEEQFKNLKLGGHGYSKVCKAKQKLAIIVPFRDRKEHLRMFLINIHNLLTIQQQDYAIFIVEQIHNQAFNRAKLMNVGYLLASYFYDWDCYIFHDIDTLPENVNNIYRCDDENPLHLSLFMSKYNYSLPYKDYFSGVIALTPNHIKRINGFPNDYWGWGGEDDDIALRLNYSGLRVIRNAKAFGYYTNVDHEKDVDNPINECRLIMLRFTKRRWRFDGLSNLNFQLISTEQTTLYTKFLIDLEQEESRAWFDTQKYGFACHIMKNIFL